MVVQYTKPEMSSFPAYSMHSPVPQPFFPLYKMDPGAALVGVCFVKLLHYLLRVYCSVSASGRIKLTGLAVLCLGSLAELPVNSPSHVAAGGATGA